MTDPTSKLIEALTEKERVEGFLIKLARLKAEGGIPQDQYATTSADYEQRLSAAEAQLEGIRNELRQQLQDNQQQLEACRRELARLELRYKVGELPAETYQSSQQGLQARMGQLEANGDRLQRLIAARFPADVEAIPGGPAPAAEAPAPPPVAGPPPAPSTQKEFAGPSPPGRVGSIASKLKVPGGRRTLLIGGAVLAAAVVAVAAYVLMAERGEGAGPLPGTGGAASEVSIPVNIQGAAGVGSLQVEIAYDDTVLQAAAVEKGAAVGDALFEDNVGIPGLVIVGIVSSGGISGDGTVATITFQVNEEGGTSSPLIVQNLAAHDAATLAEIGAHGSEGSYDPESGSMATPTIVFS